MQAALSGWRGSLESGNPGWGRVWCPGCGENSHEKEYKITWSESWSGELTYLNHSQFEIFELFFFKKSSSQHFEAPPGALEINRWDLNFCGKTWGFFFHKKKGHGRELSNLRYGWAPTGQPCRGNWEAYASCWIERDRRCGHTGFKALGALRIWMASSKNHRMSSPIPQCWNTSDLNLVSIAWTYLGSTKIHGQLLSPADLRFTFILVWDRMILMQHLPGDHVQWWCDDGTSRRGHPFRFLKSLLFHNKGGQHVDQDVVGYIAELEEPLANCVDARCWSWTIGCRTLRDSERSSNLKQC